jgi:(p)ppGpp synthase/HD superfamily hydrolase
MYAQTNIQLFNQVRRQGYSSDDVALISHGYRFSLPLFSGRFRVSGKTFFAHLIGTASILASQGVDGALVTAGLLHAAYTHGDFGDGGRGLSDDKREQVRGLLGDRVEEYVARYAGFRWDAQSIPSIPAGVSSMDQADRDVITIRLANELDEYLDLGMLYGAGNRQRLIDYTKTTGPILVEIATRLGWPRLAEELTRVFDETLATTLSIDLSEAIASEDESFVILPTSCRRLMDALAGRLSSKPSGGA